MAQLSPDAPAQDRAAAHPLLSALLVLAGAALFGTVGTAQALGPDVPPSSLAATRMLVSAIAFTLLGAAVGSGSGILPALRQSPTWLAGAGQAAFNLFFLAAMKETGVAVGTLVAIGAAPVITGLITRHVTRLWLAATTVAVAGLALLVVGQQSGSLAASPLGVGLSLGAAASYATYIVAGNAAERRRIDTQSFLAGVFSVSALLTLPWLVTGDLGWVGSRDGLLLLGYLVLVPTILSYSLFNRGLRGVRSSTASTLALIEPVIAATLAYVLLDEQLSPLGLVGAAMILLGLLLIVRSAAGDDPDHGASDVPVRPVG